MVRRVFYSFHYVPDCWRAATVRSIGVIEGNKAATDNDWESVKKGGDAAIQRWIAGQMDGRSCAVVLVGSNTANRKWINHEIIKAWKDGLGVVGIRIHGLKDAAQQTSVMGANPFDYITCGNAGQKLSSIVKCYDPAGAVSQQRYDWIKTYLADAVEEAINIRLATQRIA
jgi:antiphage defense system Thoeris ThsB-like protein